MRVHLKNCEIALRRWKEVPNSNVIPGLTEWVRNGGKGGPYTCGTIACFGGWFAIMPEFVEMGVTVGSDGRPVYKGMYDISRHFFGRSDMFSSVGTCGLDLYHSPTDKFVDAHATVTHRLESQIDLLKEYA